MAATCVRWWWRLPTPRWRIDTQRQVTTVRAVSWVGGLARYAYYGLSSAGLRRYVRACAPWITMLQLVQFMSSFAFFVYSLHAHYIPRGWDACAGTVGLCFNISFNIVLLFLFARLFCDRYGRKQTKRKAA